MVQRGFTGVHEEFASVHDEIADVRATTATKHELIETREVLAQAMKDMDMRLVAYVGSSREEFDRLKAWMEDIDDRISALEGKRHRKAA